MALNDAQLASMRQLLKHYERTITALVKDGAQSIRHADNTRLFHEVGKIRDKLAFYKKKFGQTGNAIGNAMRVHPRQQIGAFGHAQARSRMQQLEQTRSAAEKVARRIAVLVDEGATPADFQHKGIIDIANKMEKQFTELGEAFNPFENDGPAFHAAPGATADFTVVLHLMIVMAELVRARLSGLYR